MSKDWGGNSGEEEEPRQFFLEQERPGGSGRQGVGGGGRGEGESCLAGAWSWYKKQRGGQEE